MPGWIVQEVCVPIADDLGSQNMGNSVTLRIEHDLRDDEECVPEGVIPWIGQGTTIEFTLISIP